MRIFFLKANFKNRSFAPSKVRCFNCSKMLFRTGLTFCLLSGLLLLAGSRAADALESFAPANISTSGKTFNGERISLDFQNAELHSILRLLSEVSGRNVVVSDGVNGKVTVKLKDVPWDQALDIILSAQGLAYTMKGNVISVSDLATSDKMRQRKLDDLRAYHEMEELAPLVQKVFSPKYNSAEIISDALLKMKSSRGTVALVGPDIQVEDVPSSLAAMNKAFERLDILPRQVFVEVKMVETTPEVLSQLSRDWGQPARPDPSQQNLYQAKLAASGLLDFNPQTSRLDFHTLSPGLSSLLAEDLARYEKKGQLKTIAAPRVMVFDGKAVEIKQGFKVPVDKDGALAESAVSLQVLPQIEEGDKTLTLDVSFSYERPTSKKTSYYRPFMDVRETATKLMMHDGATVLIGAMSYDKKETLIFLTCRIVPLY